MLGHERLDEYDIEQIEKARELLMKVYEYHDGYSKMRCEVKRLETIIEKIDFLLNKGNRREK